MAILLLQSGREEVADCRSDFVAMRLQGEVPGLEEAHDGVGDIALELLGACREEERIIPAPGCQEARLGGTEILLEGRIERDVTLIVSKQIELHFVGARAG